MKINAAQLKKIKEQNLWPNRQSPFWSQDEKGDIYALILTGKYVSMYIFSTTGNLYRERHRLDDSGWQIMGWEKDD